MSDGSFTQRRRDAKSRKALAYSLDLDFSVEVGDPALRIGHAAFDQGVSFGPMDLTDEAPRQREVDDRPYIRHAVSMLSEPGWRGMNAVENPGLAI